MSTPPSARRESQGKGEVKKPPARVKSIETCVPGIATGAGLLEHATPAPRVAPNSAATRRSHLDVIFTAPVRSADRTKSRQTEPSGGHFASAVSMAFLSSGSSGVTLLG